MWCEYTYKKPAEGQWAQLTRFARLAAHIVYKYRYNIHVDDANNNNNISILYGNIIMFNMTVKIVNSVARYCLIRNTRLLYFIGRRNQSRERRRGVWAY